MGGFGTFGYGSVQINVTKVYEEEVGRCHISRKKRYVTLEWPLGKKMWNAEIMETAICPNRINYSQLYKLW